MQRPVLRWRVGRLPALGSPRTSGCPAAVILGTAVFRPDRQHRERPEGRPLGHRSDGAGPLLVPGRRPICKQCDRAVFSAARIVGEQKARSTGP